MAPGGGDLCESGSCAAGSQVLGLGVCARARVFWRGVKKVGRAGWAGLSWGGRTPSSKGRARFGSVGS